MKDLQMVPTGKNQPWKPHYHPTQRLMGLVGMKQHSNC